MLQLRYSLLIQQKLFYSNRQLFSPGRNQNIQRKPCDTVNRENAGIFHRRPHTPGGQSHDTLKGRLGRNEIADDRQRPAYPDQSA